MNEITISDKFPIPKIDHILDKLGKSQYFTTVNLARGKGKENCIFNSDGPL